MIHEPYEGDDEPGSGAVAAAGWAFDCGSIAVTLVDITTNVLVALQLHAAGHRGWALAILVMLLLSSLVYTVFGGETLGDAMPRAAAQRFYRVPRALRYLLIFPVALLVPVANWAISVCVPPQRSSAQQQQRDDARRGSFFAAADPTLCGAGPRHGGVPAAVSEDMRQVTVVRGPTHDFLALHIRAHVMFVVDALAQSLPQCVIQLLAMALIDAPPSPLQIASVFAATLTIALRAYVVSFAFDVRVLVFKFAVVAHDVCSLFYVFVTVVSGDAGPGAGVRLPGMSVDVSYLAAIWITKLAVVAAVAALVATVLAVAHIAHHLRNGPRVADALAGVSVLVGAVIISPLLLLIAETLKLSWAVIAMAHDEPPESSFAAASVLWGFVHRDGDAPAREQRAHHVATSYLAVFFDDFAELLGRYRDPARRRRVELEAPPRGTWLWEEARPAARDEFDDDDDGSMTLPSVVDEDEDEARVLTPGDMQRCAVYAAVCGACAARPPAFRSAEVPRATRAVLAPPSDWRRYLVGGAAAAVYGPACVISVLFPFASAAAAQGNQSVLQRLCLVDVVLWLALAAVLAPRARRYRTFCRLLRPLDAMLHHVTPRRAMGWIEAYFEPSPVAALHSAILPAVLPRQVLEMHVAPLLRRGDVVVRHLSVAECDALRLQEQRMYQMAA
jgi:hypothetical protein